MQDRFNGYRFLRYLAGRWKLPAAALLVALAGSLFVSLLLPKQYTATASLVIELPAGSDPRAAAAVSPIYLESLKTFEHFALSDEVFAQAADHFGLRVKGGRPIESAGNMVA